MDEIKEDGMKSIIALIKENDANWKIGLSGGNVDSGIENSLYDYSTILGYERQSDNAVSTFSHQLLAAIPEQLRYGANQSGRNVVDGVVCAGKRI